MEESAIPILGNHKIIRDSWLFPLNCDSSFVLIGETSNIDEPVEIANNKRPNVILSDVNMTTANGFDTTRLFRKYTTGTRVIGVSVHSTL